MYLKTQMIDFSYDSTEFIEALALNVLTVPYWQNGFDNLTDSAKI